MEKKSVIKLIKRALILGFVLMLGAGGVMIVGEAFISAEGMRILALVASAFAFFFLIWPAVTEAGKVIEKQEEENEELFP